SASILLKYLFTSANEAPRNPIAMTKVIQYPNVAANSPAASDPIKRPAPIIALFMPRMLPALPFGIIFSSDDVVVVLQMLKAISTVTNTASVIISIDSGLFANNNAAATAVASPNILGM